MVIYIFRSSVKNVIFMLFDTIISNYVEDFYHIINGWFIGICIHKNQSVKWINERLSDFFFEVKISNYYLEIRETWTSNGIRLIGKVCSMSDDKFICFINEIGVNSNDILDSSSNELRFSGSTSRYISRSLRASLLTSSENMLLPVIISYHNSEREYIALPTILRIYDHFRCLISECYCNTCLCSLMSKSWILKRSSSMKMFEGLLVMFLCTIFFWLILSIARRTSIMLFVNLSLLLLLNIRSASVPPHNFGQMQLQFLLGMLKSPANGGFILFLLQIHSDSQY